MKTKFIPILLGAVMMFSACDVHQWPMREDAPDVPVEPAVIVKIPIHLTYTTDFYLWEHNYDPMKGSIEQKNPDLNIFENFPGASLKYSNIPPYGNLLVHIKAYNEATGDVARDTTIIQPVDGTSYDSYYELELEGNTNYRLAVWSHLMENESVDPFYDYSNFNSVSLIPENYKANTDFRDGFRGTERVSAGIENASPTEIAMSRPMGKFELVSIDLSEFLIKETKRRGLSSRARAEEYHVVISYPMYYPSSYSLLDDRLENSSSGVSFSTTMTVNGEEASIGFDYVMLNDIPNAGVQIRVDIYDPSYTLVSSSSTLSVPMRRDGHTLLRGTFLTLDGNGGIGIDPSFDGEHTVFI